jgi:protein SCO1/2
MRRSVSLLASALAVALTAGACTASGETFHGVVRDEPLEVGSIRLPDVTDPAERAGGVVEDGRLVLRAASDDRLLLVYFGFLNCPDVCPTTLADLRSARARLDRSVTERIDLAFVTVDPDRDGPDELAAYLTHFAPQHHAVRPEGAELQAALDAFLASASVEELDDGTIDVAHTAVLYAVDSAGRVVLEWPFGTSATAMADDLTALLSRTPAGRA